MTKQTQTLIPVTKSELDAIKDAYKDTELNNGFDLTNLFAGLNPEIDARPIAKWAVHQKNVEPAKFYTALRTWRFTTQFGDFPQHTDHLVDLFLKRYNAAIAYNGMFKGDEELGVEPTEASVALTINNMVRRYNGEKFFPASYVSDSLSQWVIRSRDAEYRKVRDLILSAPAGAADWSKLPAATAHPDHSPEYSIAVLKTFVWCVKRKLARDPAYPPKDHLMPILNGPQGAGKTEFVKAFCAPLGSLMYFGDFHQITDVNNRDIWSYPVIFCDEMERADRSDIEAVKNAITSGTRSGRTLYKMNTSTILNRGTLIGATNTSLGDKIKDATGLRRFAQYTVRFAPTAENIAAGLPVMDWQVIAEIDYLTLWQSVDYKSESPLKSCPIAYKEWQGINESERNQDSVESFLRQFKSFSEKDWWQTSDLYSRYRDYCLESGFSAMAINTFGQRMKHHAIAPWFPFTRTVSKGVVKWKLDNVIRPDVFASAEPNEGFDFGRVG